MLLPLHPSLGRCCFLPFFFFGGTAPSLPPWVLLFIPLLVRGVTVPLVLLKGWCCFLHPALRGGAVRPFLGNEIKIKECDRGFRLKKNQMTSNESKVR